MDSIEIKIGEHTVTFHKQSVEFSGSEYFYGKMSDIVHRTEPIPCYEFTYDGQREALYYNLKNEKIVTSVFDQVIALNRQKEAAAAPPEAEAPAEKVQDSPDFAAANPSEPVSDTLSGGSAEPADEPAQNPAEQTVPEVPGGFPENGESTAEYLIPQEKLTEKPKSSKKIIIAVVIAVVIIAAAIAGVVLNSKDSSDDAPPAATAPSATSSEEKGIYQSGTYHVGVDLPKGVYLITGSGYLSVSTDKSGTLENMITNANYTNRYFIQVDTDQYLTFSGKAQLASDAPAYANTETLVPGMYLVGKDLPAGKYTVKDDGDAYVAVMRDAKGTIDSIISNSNFTDSETITVKDGQFIELKNCKIELKNTETTENSGTEESSQAASEAASQ